MNIRDMQKILNRMGAIEEEMLRLKNMIEARAIQAQEDPPFDSAQPRRTLSLKKDGNGSHG